MQNKATAIQQALTLYQVLCSVLCIYHVIQSSWPCNFKHCDHFIDKRTDSRQLRVLTHVTHLLNRDWEPNPSLSNAKTHYSILYIQRGRQLWKDICQKINSSNLQMIFLFFVFSIIRIYFREHALFLISEIRKMF